MKQRHSPTHDRTDPGITGSNPGAPISRTPRYSVDSELQTGSLGTVQAPILQRKAHSAQTGAT
jgi:hypothetical protein